MWIGAIGAGMVFIGFIGVWLTSAEINRKSEKEVAKLTQEVNVQRQTLEEKDQAISGLLERQRPRQLTPKQEEQFLHILMGAPTGSIMVESLADSEPLGLALKMRQLFQTAGWTIGGQPGLMVFIPPIVGVVLEVEHPGSADPKTAAIQQAFGAVGIAMKVSDQPSPTVNWFTLSIGPKH